MRGKLYTERIELCLTEGQREIIRKIAKRDKLTINQVIRNIIEQHIRKG